jgi:ADP-ribosyl-[dinitrogen reductase] hydrolase
VVKGLEASLRDFHETDAFEEAVLRAVNLGDEADTTWTICGDVGASRISQGALADILGA